MIDSLTPLECANTLYKATTKLQVTAEDHQILLECFQKVSKALSSDKEITTDEVAEEAGNL